MREGHVEGVVGLVSDSWMDSEVDSRVDSEIYGEEALEERLLREGSKIFCSPLWRRLVGFCICSSPHFRYLTLKVFRRLTDGGGHQVARGEPSLLFSKTKPASARFEQNLRPRRLPGYFPLLPLLLLPLLLLRIHRG